MIAQELSALGHKLNELDKRLAAGREGEHATGRGCTNHGSCAWRDFRSLGRGL